MKKELLKKVQLGMVSLSTIALLAACGDNGMDVPDLDDEPAIEEPADEDAEDGGTTGGVSEEEEEAN